MAMGINLSVSRLGSVVNDQTSVAFYKATGLSFTLWIGVMVLGGSLGSAMIVAFLDKKVETEAAALNPTNCKLTASRCTFNDAVGRSFSANKSFAGTSFLGGSFTAPLNPTRTSHQEKGPAVDEPEEEGLLEALGNFSQSFWIICGGCVVVYATVLPFNNIASGFLGHKFYPGLIDVPRSVNPSYKESAVSYANTWMMVPFIISAVLSPFLGGVVDRIGKRSYLMLCSAITLTAVHTFFAFGPPVPCPGLKDGVCYDPHTPTMTVACAWYAHPAVGLVFQGIAYSVYAAAIWPAIVYVVKPNQVGTAYGLVTAVQNSGLAIAPLVVGGLTELTPASDPSRNSGGYKTAEYFFMACGVCGIILSIWLNSTVDGQRLNKRDPDEDGRPGDLIEPASPI
jgi:hypothetical protein